MPVGWRKQIDVIDHTQVDKNYWCKDNIAKYELYDRLEGSHQKLSNTIRVIPDDTVIENLELFLAKLIREEIVTEVLLAMLLRWGTHQIVIKLNDDQESCKVHDLLDHWRFIVRSWKNLPHCYSKGHVGQKISKEIGHLEVPMELIHIDEVACLGDTCLLRVENVDHKAQEDQSQRKEIFWMLNLFDESLASEIIK